MNSRSICDADVISDLADAPAIIRSQLNGSIAGLDNNQMTETNMNWLKRICVATLLVPTLVFAQAWPTKSIKMIVPFPPGGGVDYLGRLAAKGLGDLLGTKV